MPKVPPPSHNHHNQQLTPPNRRRSLRRRTPSPPRHPRLRPDPRPITLHMVQNLLPPPSRPVRLALRPPLPSPRQPRERHHIPRPIHLKPHLPKPLLTNPINRLLQIQRPHLPLPAATKLPRPPPPRLPKRRCGPLQTISETLRLSPEGNGDRGIME
jgi:hypothetical protein